MSERCEAVVTAELKLRICKASRAGLKARITELEGVQAALIAYRGQLEVRNEALAAVVVAAVAYHDQWAVPSNVAMHQARHKQLMDAVATYQAGLLNV